MSNERERHAYHHGSLIDAVLDEVARIVDDKGLESVSLRACARRVGVSHSALFRHFSDKRHVLTAFATRSAERMAQSISEKVVKSAPEQKFLVVGLAYIDFATRNPGPFRVIFREDAINPSDVEYREAMDKLADCLALGGHGGGNDGSLSPKAMLAWASVHGIATLCVDGSLSRDVSESQLGDLVEATLQQLSPVLREPS